MLVFSYSLLLNVFECFLPNDAEIFLLEPKGRKDKREEGAWASFTVLSSLLSSVTVQIGPLNASAVSLKSNKGLRLRAGGGGVMLPQSLFCCCLSFCIHKTQMTHLAKYPIVG